MTNLQKALLFLAMAAVLFYGISKIGIITMLILSVILLLIALITFLIWATRPTPTHRNNLQGFSMNFESKRIEFVPAENGLYQVNLCTKYFDSIEASKWETSTENGKTLVFEKLPLKLQKFYFTNDKAIQLSDKLLTEKQAKNLYFRLLKDAKNQSVANAVYISHLIESVGKPLFFTANRVQAFKQAKSNVQARMKAKKAKISLSPTVERGANLPNTVNNTMVLSFFAISMQFNTVEMQAVEMLENESDVTLIMLLILLLVFGTIYNKFHNYLTNDCIQQ